MAKQAHYTVLGLYGKLEVVANAVDPIREKFGVKDGDIQLLTSAALPENAIVEDHRPYPIVYFVWVLGVVGFFLAIILAGGTGWIMNLNVGGKPPFSWAPTGIITYEFTLLFGVIGTVVGLLYFTGLPDWNDRAYDRDISDGALGLLLKVANVHDQEEAAKMMSQSGAYKIVKGENNF